MTWANITYEVSVNSSYSKQKNKLTWSRDIQYRYQTVCTESLHQTSSKLVL